MRSLLVTPSVGADDMLVDAADWAEISALFKADGTISREDLARAIFRSASIREVRARQIAEDAFTEIADRVVSCGTGTSDLNRYPFRLDAGQTLLSLKRPFRTTSNFGLLYWFLLFVTRAEMDAKERILASVDPTKAFEQLCGDVLGAFWGGTTNYSGSIVMGTSSKPTKTVQNFQSKIQQLCEKLAEGAGWRAGGIAPGAGDAKLDVVAWKRFADKRQGALVGFAQCKTGVHWKDHLTKLKPRTFCLRFMQRPLVIAPLRLYMVPNRIVSHRWEEHTSDGGLLLDRCRLVQYGGAIAAPTLHSCKKWLMAAYKRQKSGRVTS